MRVPPFHMCPKLTCCPFVCRDLEARHPCFLTFYVGCSLFSCSMQELGFCLMMGLTFLWPIPWFPLFLTMSYYYSYCNNLILLGLFWANRLFLLLVAWHGHCFAFTYGLLCPFGLSFGHSWPVCFLWASSALFLISHSHGLFTNFIGLP